MWRINRDETKYTDAELLAWDHVLPQMHLPIIQQDKDDAKNLENWLKRTFSTMALNSAVTRRRLK